ncbi:hypothetical protein SPONN_2474 [uncultured Candidatus Thioglobus sp.]|nr:hypothetical protein SPONN_2474 [uncultured Candidatus Thioglobus sp.]
MEALHLRADHNTIKTILSTINQLSKTGKKVEILDNLIYDKEKEMVLTGLIQQKEHNTFSHNEVWEQLLK